LFWLKRSQWMALLQKKRRGRPAGDETQATALAQRIMSQQAHEQPGGSMLAAFPSERDLATRFGVSRHAVRSAMDYLETRGVISKLPGRGMVVVRSVEGSAGVHQKVRCINFIQGTAVRQPSMQWQHQEYLDAYTRVLDMYDIKIRFLVWEDDREDFPGMFWPHLPWEQQACVLVNRRMAPMLNWLNDQRLPYVVQSYTAYDLDGLPPHRRVFVNKIQGAFEAVRHLIELGHRRIGYVGKVPGQPGMSGLTPEYEGWEMALRWAGLSPRKADVVSLTSEEIEPVLEPCTMLLQREDRPTAVVAGHGGPAVALTTAAQNLGLHVPEDLSVIGFTSHMTYGRSNLSTIEVPRHELARDAVEMVLKITDQDLANPQQIDHMLQCNLALRGSTARPLA
jgi:DNA-binding LacI/PurR family transcriptional regulator/DNA-binding transcriptional regulator YhcF (GntR family)